MAKHTSDFRAELAVGLIDSLELAEPFHDLTDAQLNWRPADDAWSIGQCIEHLLLANRQYLPVMRAAVDSTPPREGDEEPTYRSSFLGRLMVYAVGPDSKMSVPVPKQLVPSAAPVTQIIVKEFDTNTRAIIQLLADTAEIDLSRVKIQSPFAVWMRLRLGDAFKIIEVHNKRHLLQAARVLSQESFPTMAQNPME